MSEVLSPGAKVIERTMRKVALVIGLTLALSVSVSNAQALGCRAPELSGEEAKLAIAKCKRLRRVMQPNTENRVQDGTGPQQGSRPQGQSR